MKSFIGLDIGTSSVKGMLLTSDGQCTTCSRDYPVFFPQDGYSEQNPTHWYDKSIEIIKELTENIDKATVDAISFSGQMHGLVMLDEFDEVIRPAILWNDGRSSKETDYLNNTIGKQFLLEHTGNIAFSGFTASKLMWVRENEPDNFNRAKKIMLPKDYVSYRLSGVFATDCSDASGTMYFDTKNRCWSREMLQILGIDETQLPTVFESDSQIGTLKDDIAHELGLSPETKIIIGGGDNAVSAVGTNVVGDGECNISLGTSGTIFVACDSFNTVGNGAIHSFCSATGKYHFLACILSAASCQKWWIEDITHSSYSDDFSEYIGNSNVMFLPYLMGERSPINDTSVRGAFTNLSLDTTKNEMTVAVLEGVSFAIKQNLEIIKETGLDIKRAKICGGGARNRKWVEILSSVLSLDILLSENEPGASFGAALLAAKQSLSRDQYDNLVSRFTSIKETIKPNAELSQYYEEKYSSWKKIYPSIRAAQQLNWLIQTRSD